MSDLDKGNIRNISRTSYTAVIDSQTKILKEEFDFEKPLTSLIWLTSIISIAVTFAVSYFMLPRSQFGMYIWWKLSVIISCGTLDISSAEYP